jgi:hypothetical protein
MNGGPVSITSAPSLWSSGFLGSFGDGATRHQQGDDPPLAGSQRPFSLSLSGFVAFRRHV